MAINETSIIRRLADVTKVRELAKLFLPDAEDGQWRNDQHSLDFVVEEQSTGDSYRG